eukprot:TRINITY_DN7775_c0_g2_i1.p1 TRINITY_DN7775_c0_g2~~TRINITY_DN7775_c0_g2_i1.p1  ORF type:complete len:706 (-),score=118.16 TRINITY_DN7775_c0_g2_i1:483-2600(-)
MSHLNLVELEKQCESLSLAGATAPFREGPLFEQFFIVGLPPDTPVKCSKHMEQQVHQPRILYQYPPSDVLHENSQQVSSFCFPRGITTTAIARTSSASNLNMILFGTFSAVEKPDRSFVFMFSGCAHLLFGICVSKDEELTKSSAFFEGYKDSSSSSSSSKLADFREQYDVIAPRCYCLVSRFPFISMHFQVLYTILERERIFTIMEYSNTVSAIGPADSVEHKILSPPSAIEVLTYYHSIEQPKECTSLSFKLPGESSTIQFYCPFGDEHRLIADWGMSQTLEHLTPENLITLYNYIILERSVIFTSKNLGTLSAVVLSFIPLLRPFVWQCTIVPVLPDSLNESLDSPIPFLMGLQSIPQDFLDRPHDCLVVNLDNSSFIYPSNHTRGSSPTHSPRSPLKPHVVIPHIPPLPERRQFLESIRKSKQQFSELQGPPLQHRRIKLVEEMLSIFWDYHSWLIDEIGAAILSSYKPTAQNPTPDVSYLEYEGNFHSVLEYFEADYREFYSTFLKTQLFSVFSQKLMTMVSEKSNSTQKLSERIADLIKMEEKSREVLQGYKQAAERIDKTKAELYERDLKKSEGVLNVLKVSKKQLETETAPKTARKTSTGFLAGLLPELGNSPLSSNNRKLDLGKGGHRRSRSITDQIEETVFKALQLTPPSAPHAHSSSDQNSPSQPHSLSKSLASLNTKQWYQRRVRGAQSIVCA